jgi:hypothetical protein
MKISDTIWLVVTRRGNIYAAGPEARTAIATAVRKHQNSPHLADEIINYYWESMLTNGYKCISLPVSVELTDDEVDAHHERASQSLLPQKHYDP